MAQLWQSDKLQPSLLDRLTDDEALTKNDQTAQTDDQKTVAKGERTARLMVNSRNLREFVKRDLAALLNTGNLEDVVDLEDYPNAARSVVNYGIPDLAGMLVSNTDVYILQKKIHSIITTYEPRVIAKTLHVKVSKTDAMSQNALKFVIECDIWGQPAPEHLYLNSELDLETGLFKLSDRHAEL